MKQVDISNGNLTILIALDEKLHLVAFERSKMEVLETMIKRSIDTIAPTPLTQYELNELLNYHPKENTNATSTDQL